MNTFDTVVIGAGAAGLFCAGIAGQRGKRVLLLDHSPKLAEKMRISGGGRCNFTNRELDRTVPQRHFLSENPHFCRSALGRYTPADFIGLLQRHNVPFEEKHKGQLFASRSAEDIIDVLLRECDAGHVTRWQPCAVANVRSVASAPAHDHPVYELDTDRGQVQAPKLVIATGGLSIPKIGASDFGYRIAQQFGLRIVPTRPALVPLTFDAAQWEPYASLSGLALPVLIETGQKKNRMVFAEDLLFTHRGLSGPAALQISSYWKDGASLRLNLAPDIDLRQRLGEAKAVSRKLTANVLAGLIPARLAEALLQSDPIGQRPINETSDKALAALAERLSGWELTPNGTEGYRKAEVTVGGVDTRDLSSQTMESKQPGLYFIGEVVDVTGWLGGYNFQWAWSSAHACAMAAST